MQNQQKLSRAIVDFEHWRKTRVNKHVTIPDELRRVALELLEEYQISQVTKALRISTAQINAWRKQFFDKQPAPDFVPLQIEPSLQHQSALSLQLTLPNSSQIHISGDMAPDLLRALIQQVGELR